MRRAAYIKVGMAGILVVSQVSLAAAPAEFEVASVKPSKPGNNGVRGGCHGIDSKYGPTEGASAPPLGRCVITDGRLSHMIGIAYGITMQVIKGGPDWVMGGDDRFNLEAKVEDPTKATEAQLLEMLQNLLTERFKMKSHRETVERAGFAMVVGKNGPKLKASKSDETAMSFGPGAGKPAPGGPINLSMRKTSMAALATLLGQIGPGPVIDKTGLDGQYDFTLSWDETNGPALTTAVPEQLGLRLEAQKVPISMFVIESAEKPGEN